MIAPATGCSGALERALVALREALHATPAIVARAPGRVNLIGEHVHYNDGFVLPAAIDRDVAVAAAPRPDSELHVLAVDRGEMDRFTPFERFPRGVGWTSYVRGVCRVLADAGVRIPGATLAIAGDVPQGAGLSSSSALEVAVASALLALAKRTLPDLQLVELCHRVEAEYAAASCCIMDQFASVFGARDRALFLDCRHLECAHLPIPREYRLVATDSGIRADPHGAVGQERIFECREASRLLGVRSLRDIDPREFFERERELPELLRRRARHVVSEIRRTRLAARALERGDIRQLGLLMGESHQSLREDYQVSLPEIDVLVGLASIIEGVAGSRLAGAGFGGCTISLVHEDAVPEFIERVPREYRARTSHEAVVHVCRASAGALATDQWE